MPETKSRSWIIIDHPVQFLLACNISILLTKKYGYRSNLLISDHAYWKHFKIDKYSKLFSKIYWFKRLDYPPPHMSILKQIVAALILLPELILMRIKLSSLNVRKTDLVFGLTNCAFLESLALGTLHPYKNIGVVSTVEYEDWFKTPRDKKFGTNIATEIVHFIRKIFKMPEFVFLFNKEKSKFGDGDYYLSSKKMLSNIFDDLILITGNQAPPISKHLDKNIYLVKYPQKMQDFSKKKRRKMVVFLGNEFLRLTTDAARSVYETNKYLDYLRKYYSDQYDLVYKPHPRETIETKLLYLNGFTKLHDKRPAEIFFTEHKRNIAFVFTVVSSASISAYNLGINSYLFMGNYSLDKKRLQTYKYFFHYLPKECFIENLKERPKAIRWKQETGVGSIEKTIRKIVK